MVIAAASLYFPQRIKIIENYHARVRIFTHPAINAIVDRRSGMYAPEGGHVL